MNVEVWRVPQRGVVCWRDGEVSRVVCFAINSAVLSDLQSVGICTVIQLIDHHTTKLQKIILSKETQLIARHFSVHGQGQVSVIKLPFAKQAGGIGHRSEGIHIIIVGSGSVFSRLL